MPLHPRRLVTRGYNQAALLAQELSRSSGLTNLPRLLRRTREMERQVGKSREQRVENAQGAFELRQPGPPHVVLVDDVLFSGRTGKAALDELFDHGRPAKVELAVLVERGGRLLPIAADYVGLTLAPSAEEKVAVFLEANDPAADAIHLEKRSPSESKIANPKSKIS